ncbi:MAG: hypothetical protein JST89_21020 [Cyanobacteria bacterium SZAS-4]|nr:hypothetical protein [Cyanobacteria bacterium SZAS-4]
MGKGSEDLGNNLDKAAAANGKGDHDSANVAAAAYAPETDAQSKIKNVQQLNQALQDSGLLPGVSITDTKGQDGESIRLEIAPTDANAHTGLNGSHHTAIYNSTTHELTFQRDAVLPGNSGRENVSVNMVTGQETVTNKISSASPRQTRVTTRDAVGDAACTDAIVEKYGSSDAVVINTQSFDAQGHPIETEASKTVANVT